MNTKGSRISESSMLYPPGAFPFLVSRSRRSRLVILLSSAANSGLTLSNTDHLAEGSSSLPPFPISFLKAPTSLVGHRAPVIYPRRVKLLDYEVELATVIGKECKEVPRKDALDYVAGFSVFNDISARDIQFAEMKRGFCNLGKNFDTFGPMGPCLVTPDQAGNPD